MKTPAPEAVSSGVVMLFGVLEPFLGSVGQWLTVHAHIVFPPDYIAGRLIPFVTAVATYFIVQKARLWHEESR